MAFRIISKSQAPQYAPEPAPPPVCTRFARCEGCPYPQHGFICWHSDGSCMKDQIKKISAKEKNKCNFK